MIDSAAPLGRSLKSGANNLIIRADANARIGTGHLMRCLALAQEWSERGGKVTFLSRCDSAPLNERINREGFELIRLEKSWPDPSDLEKTLYFLNNKMDQGDLSESVVHPVRSDSGRSKPWLILDGYQFTPEYHEAIRDAGFRLLVIDDHNHLETYRCDILLNQNSGADLFPYHCNSRTIQLLGPKYALLRKEFLQYKEHKFAVPDKAKKILITMGGSDPDNVTKRILSAMRFITEDVLDIKVIVGPLNPNKITLFNTQILPHNVHFVLEADMPNLMKWANLAISASGSTCWELAYFGVPFFTIVLADNQFNIAQSLEKIGCSSNLGWFFDIKEELLASRMSDMLRNSQKRNDLSGNCRRLVDGLGSQRVLQRIFGV